MNKLEELKETEKKLNKQIAELEDAEKPWPQEGDKCYVVFASGLIEQRGYHSEWKNELKQGRVFQTKAEAVWARDWYADNAKKMHVLYELEQWAKGFNGSEVKLNFSLYHNGTTIACAPLKNNYDNLPKVYKNCAEELLAHFGDRLNVLFEGA